jgi:predicted restriction endonuclease
LVAYQDVLGVLSQAGVRNIRAEGKSSELAAGDEVLYLHNERGAPKEEKQRSLHSRRFERLYFYIHPESTLADRLRHAGFGPSQIRFSSSFLKFPKRQNNGQAPEHFGLLFAIEPMQLTEFGHAVLSSLSHDMQSNKESETTPNAAQREARDFRRSSALLVLGQVYTREELRQRFAISDATLNTGIFQPQGFASVWLFVTETKTRDRTQYEDRLDGDTLYWQGQTAGRKDALVIEHRQRDLEVLLFYRKEKYEHPRAGFRYEGVFNYVSHRGANPATFTLHRALTDRMQAEEAVEQSGDFDPTDMQDARRKVLAAIVRRQGQRVFRQALLDAYGERCAISGCAVKDVLEAAHIFPYQGDHTNHVTNGILLRADLHTLFDLHLISLEESGKIVIANALRKTDYAWLADATLRMPANAAHRPSSQALSWHRDQARQEDPSI